MSQQLIKNALEEEAITAYVKLLRTAESLRGRVTAGLAPHNLTASQFSIMKALRLRGPLAQRDIARYLFMASGNVTVVIDNLQKRGLALRTRDTTDRRIVFVSLTEEGTRLFDEIYPSHLERIRKVMGELDKQGVASLVSCLQALDPQDYEPLCLSDAEIEKIDASKSAPSPEVVKA